MITVSTPQEQTRRAPWRQPWFLVLIGVIVVTIAVAVVIEVTSSSGSGGRTGSNSTAERKCRDAVTVRLKSPASAQFSKPSTIFEPGDTADFYTVAGTVDSQNSFGAMLRSRYTCKLVAERDGLWRMNDFVLLPR